MEEVLLRFGHIGTQIFEQLDDQTFTNCRSVSKSWKTILDNERISSFKMIKFKIDITDENLKKFLMKRNPECCMELAKFSPKYIHWIFEIDCACVDCKNHV